MSLKIADNQKLRETPSEMSPPSQPFFAFHPGHQTILEARNPFARAGEPIRSNDPIGWEDWRIEFSQRVMDAINSGGE